MRSHFAADKAQFDHVSDQHIIGVLTKAHEHDLQQAQTYAWYDQIKVMRQAIEDADLRYGKG